MEHFAQTNVFAQIRTTFAWFWTIFAHLINGCTIRYLKIDNLRYVYHSYGCIYLFIVYSYIFPYWYKQEHLLSYLLTSKPC